MRTSIQKTIQMKTIIRPILIIFTLLSLGLVPITQAVSPPPDGGYPGANTAEGDGALFRLSETDGSFNTAVGWYSLSSDVVGGLNTGVGAGALALNTSHNNTATGAGALLLNTTGTGNTATGAGALVYNSTGDGNTAVGAAVLSFNTQGRGSTGVGARALLNNTADGSTAVGVDALTANTMAIGNTAVGARALKSNVTGPGNTALGAEALLSNTESGGNTAVGARALQNNAGAGDQEGNLNTAVGLNTLTANTIGQGNTAVGAGPGVVPQPSPEPPLVIPAALGSNTTGSYNTAVGAVFFDLPAALGKNTEGRNNTAVGNSALSNNTTGTDNIAVGVVAGGELTTGDNNIDIGNSGVAGEANTIRIGKFNSGPPPTGHNRTFIAGIYGQTPGANTLPVVCANDGKLTANASSRRFKHDIKPMDNASEAILALKPVSFRYNNDSTDTPWFGLIAEDVAKINPDLIARDKEGKPFGVRYDQVNVMLLNEFLKEHRKVEELQKQVEALTAGLQKVSAQLEVNKPAPQTVLNDQ